jgi:uncharacterized protein YycO
MKQTAVEWLVDEIAEKYNFRFATYYGQEIQQAKAMEKEQIMKAFYKGRQEEQYKNLFNNHVRKSEEQYYNETFKSE